MRGKPLTMEELSTVGEEFLAAGYKYWEAMHRVPGLGGAIAWISDTNDGLVIFTRGEYRDTILRNIPELGPVKHFGVGKQDK